MLQYRTACRALIGAAPAGAFASREAVAMECTAAGDGIRVNTVHPGVIDTPIWTKLPASSRSNAPIAPIEVARVGVPLGRVGQVQDIANGLLFLASDASNCMNGATLVIDDGMTGRRETAEELRLAASGSARKDLRV